MTSGKGGVLYTRHDYNLNMYIIYKIKRKDQMYSAGIKISNPVPAFT